jgi:hypothetical protein
MLEQENYQASSKKLNKDINMQILAKLLLLGFTTITLAASIDSGTIFVNASNRELSDAEYQKISDDYAAKREKERRNVEVTYTKDKLKTGVVYHYTVKNLGSEGISDFSIGDSDYKTYPDAEGCEVPTDDITKIKVHKATWTSHLERQEENENECLVVDSPKRDQVIEQNQSLMVSIYLKKDNPAFTQFHWMWLSGWSGELSGIVKKAK